MSTFTVRTSCGTSRDFESRREAERDRATHLDLCETCGEVDVLVVTDTGRARAEGDANSMNPDVASPGADASRVGVEEIAESFDGVPDSC